MEKNVPKVGIVDYFYIFPINSTFPHLA